MIARDSACSASIRAVEPPDRWLTSDSSLIYLFQFLTTINLRYRTSSLCGRTAASFGASRISLTANLPVAHVATKYGIT